MVAKDVMTKRVVTVGPLTPVNDLAKVLTQNHVSGVPVVDKKGEVLGIASENDIVGKKGKQVKSIMSRRVISVTEDTPIEEIASLIITHTIKRVPVTRGRKLVGVVSRADIVRAIAMGQYIGFHTPIYDL